MISLIAAIGKNNELGEKNHIPWDLPRDLQFFRETTAGHPVIMGRKTFESIGRLLPKRRNVIITRDKNYKFEGAEVVNSLEKALKLFETSPLPSPYQGEGENEIFVIGGTEIFKLAMNKADKLYITYIDGEFPNADIFFPVIDENMWEKTKSTKYQKDDLNKFDMDFVEYTRKA